MKTSLLVNVVAFAGTFLSAASQSILENIVFNEVLPDPNSSQGNIVDTDCDGVVETADEFVEIYNTNSEDIDVGGLQFWNAVNGIYTTIPDGTILGGNGFIVVIGDTEGGTLPPVGVGSHAFSSGALSSLTDRGDNLILYDPASDLYIHARYNNAVIIDPTTAYPGFSTTATRLGEVYNFGFKNTVGVSFAREPDGGATAKVHTFIGDGSVLASPGTSNMGAGLDCSASANASAMPSPAPVAQPTASPTMAPTTAPTASPTEESCPCRGRFRVLCRMLNFGLCFPWEG